jgi:FtsZ-interacting cell division protein ZipA
MVIDDVRPHDPSEPQASQPPNDTTPLIHDHEQDQEDEHKDEQEELQNADQVHDQKESIDQREMRMMEIMKDQEQDHHTQECAKPFKEITLWTTFLVIPRMG